MTRCMELLDRGGGADLAGVVSGDERSRCYWQHRFQQSKADVFGARAAVPLLSIAEPTRKGNFLGTLNMWQQLQQLWNDLPGPADQRLAIVTMLFGKGKRLSPFTQALGNRKPAFVTPMKGRRCELYLTAAELSTLYTNLWVDHLRSCGFAGVVVKWGDEVILPSLDWSSCTHDLSAVDAVRFVWRTEPTETLAREKEWISIDPASGLMTRQLARQPLAGLRERLAAIGAGGAHVGVNLGSVAVSPVFLQAGLEVFQHEVADPRLWLDWDPYLWVALFCDDEQSWQQEMQREAARGLTGLRCLNDRCPRFYERARQLRDAIERRTGRALAVAVLDFGEALWMDAGLQVQLRRCLCSLTSETGEGYAFRQLFQLPHDRDDNQNILVSSSVPGSATVRRSVVIDSVIRDPGSVLDGCVVVGGRHHLVDAPYGGSSLFSAVKELHFAGRHAITFRSVREQLQLQEGDRHTSLFLDGSPLDLRSNEQIVDLNKTSYCEPVMGNNLSFEEAGKRMAELAGDVIDARWLEHWRRG